MVYPVPLAAQIQFGFFGFKLSFWFYRKPIGRQTAERVDQKLSDLYLYTEQKMNVLPILNMYNIMPAFYS